MDARDRRAARARPGPARRAIGAWATATILVATLAWGCGTQPVPSPTPAPSASPAAYRHARPDAHSHPRLRRHAAGRLARMMTLASACTWGIELAPTRSTLRPSSTAASSGRRPVRRRPRPRRRPLSAAGRPEGHPLPARRDDLPGRDPGHGRRRGVLVPALREGPAGHGGSLKEVRVVDPRTVDFVLSSVDPTFLTTYADDPDLPAARRRGLLRGVPRRDEGPAGQGPRRSSPTPSTPMRVAPRRSAPPTSPGGGPPREDRRAPVPGGLLARGHGAVRRLRVLGICEHADPHGRGRPG